MDFTTSNALKLEKSPCKVRSEWCNDVVIVRFSSPDRSIIAVTIDDAPTHLTTLLFDK